MTEIFQGSEEWFAIRCGKVTASRVADVIARTKIGWGASRANYAAQLIAERLTGTVDESYCSAAMQRGKDIEGKARAAYEFYRDADVTEIGFVEHATVEMTGASPDGLVALDGMVEIKSPNTATHIETLLKQTIPGKYIKQMQWQMACAERQWCDFVSYDPRMPENMALFVKRVHRDDDVIAGLEAQIVEFIAEIDTKVAKLCQAYGRQGAA